MNINTILVPIDFSPHSDRALEIAIDLARSFDARIHLLHSYPITPGIITPYGVEMPAKFYVDMRRVAVQRIQQCEEKVRASEIICKFTLTQEQPSLAIVEYAENIAADLIVMGTRGLTALKHVMLGSVAERTVRCAKCPVMTVKVAAP